MKILVDADGCPNIIKQIVFRAAKRLAIKTILYANHPLTIPGSPHIHFVQVPKGFDVADSEIEKMVEKGDLVITDDIPLADAVIDKHATALGTRGNIYTKDNIKEKLRSRNMMTELRDAGQISGGPRSPGKKDQQSFANALDRFLAKNKS